MAFESKKLPNAFTAWLLALSSWFSTGKFCLITCRATVLLRFSEAQQHEQTAPGPVGQRRKVGESAFIWLGSQVSTFRSFLSFELSHHIWCQLRQCMRTEFSGRCILIRRIPKLCEDVMDISSDYHFVFVMARETEGLIQIFEVSIDLSLDQYSWTRGRHSWVAFPN